MMRIVFLFFLLLLANTRGSFELQKDARLKSQKFEAVAINEQIAMYEV